MFTIRAGIKREKAPIIGSYNNTFGMGAITMLRNILKHARNISFDWHSVKKSPYTQLLLID
jgi:hypothetical protein